MDTRTPGPESEIIGMDKPNASSAPAAILWITFVLALGLTVFLFMASRSVTNAVSAKESQKEDLESELISPSYKSISDKAIAFKEAFDILNILSTTRTSKKELVAELFTHFTNDVTVSNMQIGTDGAVLIDGTTGSYRSVGDFMTGLKSYDRLSEIKLTSAALNSAEAAPENQKIIFSLTAKLDMTKRTIETTAAAESQDAEPSSTTGAEDTSADATSTSTDSSDTSSSDTSISADYDTTTSYDSAISPSETGTSSYSEGGL